MTDTADVFTRMRAGVQRRRLLGTLTWGLGAVCMGPAIGAPRSRKRLGIFTGPTTDPAWTAQFTAALAELGLRRGDNLEIVWSHAPLGDPEVILPPLAARMAAEGLDCLLTFGSLYTQYLQRAARSTPIVTDVGDPVGNGFARSLSRPGGNITGLHQGHDAIAVKQVELLKALVPDMSCVAWIAFRPQLVWMPVFERAARTVGVGVRVVAAEHPDRLDSVRSDFAALRPAGCLGAHLYTAMPVLADAVCTLALQHRIAVASSHDNVEREGILLSYQYTRPVDAERARHLAAQVARVLRGERVADIPFEGPTRYELVINRRTATRLGIAIPAALLVFADRVIG